MAIITNSRSKYSPQSSKKKLVAIKLYFISWKQMLKFVTENNPKLNIFAVFFLIFQISELNLDLY